MCPQEHKGYAVNTLSVINKKAIALKRYGVALMFLRAHGRKSMPVCLEALLFLCSYVLMFFRVSGKPHKFTHTPDAGRVAPIRACVSFLTSSLICAIT